VVGQSPSRDEPPQRTNLSSGKATAMDKEGDNEPADVANKQATTYLSHTVTMVAIGVLKDTAECGIKVSGRNGRRRVTFRGWTVLSCRPRQLRSTSWNDAQCSAALPSTLSTFLLAFDYYNDMVKSRERRVAAGFVGVDRMARPPPFSCSVP
jgi:hypothetical protein